MSAALNIVLNLLVLDGDI